MGKVSIPFVDKVPDYEVRDGVMYIVVEGQVLVAMPLAVFKQGLEKSELALAEYDAKHFAREPGKPPKPPKHH